MNNAIAFQVMFNVQGVAIEQHVNSIVECNVQLVTAALAVHSNELAQRVNDLTLTSIKAVQQLHAVLELVASVQMKVALAMHSNVRVEVVIVVVVIKASACLEMIDVSFFMDYKPETVRQCFMNPILEATFLDIAETCRWVREISYHVNAKMFFVVNFCVPCR